VFAAVEDLAKAIGKPFSTLGGLTLAHSADALTKVGAITGAIRKMAGLGDVERMLKPNGAVVQFLVKLYRRGQTTPEYHMLVAFRDELGRMKILDRGGSGQLPQVVSTLEELTAKYGLGKTMEVLGGFSVENAFVKIVDGIANLAIAAFFTTTAVTHEENETIVQAYTVHKAVDQGGRKALETPQTKYHTVVTGDWLSKIARTYYGNMHKWPVIYSANWDTIGKNPDLIRPGQKLLIPELPAVGKIGTMK
jgi:nucleoid-associated protein YgaU